MPGAQRGTDGLDLAAFRYIAASFFFSILSFLLSLSLLFLLLFFSLDVGCGGN